MEGVREMQSSNMLSKHLPPQIALSKVFMASAQMIPPKMVYKSSSPPPPAHGVYAVSPPEAVLSTLSP